MKKLLIVATLGVALCGGCGVTVLPAGTTIVTESVRCTTTGFEELPPGRYKVFVTVPGDDSILMPGYLIVDRNTHTTLLEAK